MKLYRKNNNLAFWAFCVALFPIFGLETLDASGIDSLSLTSVTFLFQGAWTVLCALLFSFFLFKRKKSIGHKSILLTIFYACFLGSVLSISVNNIYDLLSWLRLVQYFMISFLAIVSISEIVERSGLDFSINFFISLLEFYFLFIVLILVVFFFINSSMTYSVGVERGFRLGGSVIHPNNLALAGGLYFSILLNKFLSDIKILRSFCGMVFSFVVVYFTDSSSGFLLIALSVSYLVLSYCRFGRSLIFLAFVIALIFVFFVIINLDYYIFDYSGVDDLPGTWKDRFLIYRVALTGIYANPFFGVGPFKGVQTYFSQNMPTEYFLPPHAHNYLLDSILSRGLVGGSAYVFFMLYGFYLIFKINLRKVDLNGLDRVLSVVFLIIMIQGMMESSVSGAIKPFAHVPIFSAIFLLSLKVRHRI